MSREERSILLALAEIPHGCGAVARRLLTPVERQSGLSWSTAQLGGTLRSLRRRGLVQKGGLHTPHHWALTATGHAELERPLEDGEPVPPGEELTRLREKLTRIHEENRHLREANGRTDPVLRKRVRKLRKGLSYIGHSPTAPADVEALREVARKTLEDAV